MWVQVRLSTHNIFNLITFLDATIFTSIKLRQNIPLGKFLCFDIEQFLKLKSSLYYQQKVIGVIFNFFFKIKQARTLSAFFVYNFISCSGKARVYWHLFTVVLAEVAVSKQQISKAISRMLISSKLNNARLFVSYNFFEETFSAYSSGVILRLYKITKKAFRNSQQGLNLVLSFVKRLLLLKRFFFINCDVLSP